MERVILNLVGNAIKHHDREDGLVTIGWRRLEEGFHEFTVTDDGPGVEEKYHDRIFEMFRTLKARDDSDSGGMGLAIVQRLVNSQGGTIGVESPSEGGCRFRFTWRESTAAGG